MDEKTNRDQKLESIGILAGGIAHDINNLMGGVFVNVGYWVVDESSSAASDLGMYYAQVGMEFDPEPIKIKLAGTYYGLQGDDDGSLLDNRSSGNTLSGGKYASSFDEIWAGSLEMIYSLPEETMCPIKMVGLFGDYVLNSNGMAEDTGFAAGVKLGHKKVSGAKTWQFKYQYVKLGADAWLDAFPDSDRYSGKTDVKSHEFILDIGLAKNVSLGLDYYISDALKGSSNNEHVLQTDIVMKF